MYADWKVNQLCKQDGGNTIYFHDVLPDELTLSNGKINMLAMERAAVDSPYYLYYLTKTIEAQDPTIKRLEAQLIRRRDGEVMGKSVSYIRPVQNIGVPFSHRAAHVCPEPDSVAMLISDVFRRELR